MGCDIHMMVEKRIDGEWTEIDPGREPCWWCSDPGTKGTGTKDSCCWCRGSGDQRREWFDGRNYPLFGILAGVRDYSVDPISEPRGLPDDLSSGTGLSGADHSYSWFSLREILDYDWEQAYTYNRVVDPANYVVWKHQGTPKKSCSRAVGAIMGVVSHAEMEKVIKDPSNFEEFPETRYYTEVTWTKTYREVAKYFFEDCINKLVELGDPEDIRIIFGFDS